MSKKIIISILGGLFYFGVKAQEEIVKATEAPPLKTNPIREELQRYMGYEELWYRFLTLPFDITTNANVSGFFLDIGFLFLVLLPVLLLSKKIHLIHKGSMIGCLILMLLVALPINYSNESGVPISGLNEMIKGQLGYGNPNIWGARHMMLQATLLANYFFEPLSNALKSIVGESDAFTLPFLLSVFLWILFLLNKILDAHPQSLKAIGFLTAIYSFLWFYLSAGIVWYGILFFPLILGFIFIGIQRSSKLIQFFVYGVAGCWLVLAFVVRLSNFKPINEVYSKGLVDTNTMLYQSNVINENEYLDKYFPKYSNAIEYLNQEDTSLIYSVGTMLPFFIKKSNQRLIKDNQLTSFVTLDKLFPDKIKMGQAMEAYPIKYIIFDLRLDRIDETPEKSLAIKHDAFLKFLENNPYVELLVTDRIILNEAGKTENQVFGKPIQNFGSFALFRLKE